MSVVEDFCRDALRLVLEDNVEVLKNYRPDWLCNPNTGKNLEIDFYMPSLKVGFEIQGQHHYDDKNQKNRDDIKLWLANQQGVKLLFLSVWQAGEPRTLYKLLRSVAHKRNARFPLKHFSNSWLLFVDSFKKYRETIKSIYGIQDCLVNPVHHERRKKQNQQKDKFQQIFISPIRLDFKGSSKIAIFNGWIKKGRAANFRLGGTHKIVSFNLNKLERMLSEGQLSVNI
jgi:hypothetical protein